MCIRICCSIRFVAVILMALGLAACGGGGGSTTGGSGSSAGSGTGGSAGSSGGSVTPPPAPSMTFDKTSVSIQADTSSNASPVDTVNVTVSNPPASGLYFLLTPSGKAVSGAKVVWQSATTAQLTVGVWAPGQLGAGTYAGSVRLSLCTDSACAHQISGSPMDVAVSYAVTGSALPTTTLFFTSIASQFEATTADSAPTATFQLSVANLPVDGLYVRVHSPGGAGIVASASFQQEDLISATDAFGIFKFTLANPASLGSGIYTGSLQFDVCFDANCNHHVAPSPFTEPLDYTVLLSEGREYTRRSIAIPASTDLAWNPADQQLYVTSMTGPAVNGGAITQVDAASGSVGTITPLGEDLSSIAISDDGQYAYVGSLNGAKVRRLSLPAMATDFTLSFGTDSMGDAIGAGELAVAPGNPQTVAIALKEARGIYSRGIQIFDGSVARANQVVPMDYYEEGSSIAWGGSASVLYAFRSVYPPPSMEIDTLDADSNGLSQGTVVPLQNEPVGKLVYAGGRLFGTDGAVRDAVTGTVLGRFRMPEGYQITAVLPDVANGRAFVMTRQPLQSRRMLLCFDLSSFALRSLAIAGGSESVISSTSLIPWGANGLAFVTGTELIAMSGSFTSLGSIN